MTEFTLPVHAIKGRGAATRMPHRFAADARHAFDDGWPAPDDAVAGAAAPVPTQVLFEDVKSVITRNDSPDIHFDLSINPYRGCEHGCSYCYARPTHSYLNLSPGLDFETKIIAKRNIAEVLRRELGARRYVPSLLNIGSATAGAGGADSLPSCVLTAATVSTPASPLFSVCSRYVKPFG